MIHDFRLRQRNHRGERALSMIEGLVSILIVAIMITALLNTLGAAKLGQYHTNHRKVGHLLAQALMSEILQQDYKEPDDPPQFGREPSESADVRVNYDDVDDYNGWSASPPENKDGSEIPHRTGWRRSVTVEYVDPHDLTHTLTTDSGAKRITVTAMRNDVPVASLVAIHTAEAEPF